MGGIIIICFGDSITSEFPLLCLQDTGTQASARKVGLMLFFCDCYVKVVAAVVVVIVVVVATAVAAR